MRRYLSIILLVLIAGTSCAAQDKIDKLINSLEKRSDVETTYTERRSPKKKRLYRISRILSFSSQGYYKQLEKAFEEERENTVSAVKTRTSMTYTFENDKGSSSYTLSSGGGHGPYTLIQSWKSPDADKLEGCYQGDSKLIIIDSDFSCVDFETLAKQSRQQAAEARKAAAEARKQAAESRKQASEARKAAAKARKEARNMQPMLQTAYQL